MQQLERHDPGAAAPATADADIRDLASFGYRQELARSLGGFSSFAAGFSYLSILTGMFQLFHVGFGAGGPAFFWAWPLVFAGQFLVALCFAELAAHYPLSGSVYQWSKRVGSPAVGWMAGWVYLWCLVVTLAAVALALQTTLPQLIPAAQLVAEPARNAVILGCAVIGLSTVINAVGVRLLAAINNVGVMSELLGVVGLIALLGAHAIRGPEVVFDTMGKGQVLAMGYMGPFLAAALMASYVMYGYDTAGSLAEETTEPRKRVPWAILQALGASFAFGALILLTALMAFPALGDPQLGLGTGGLPLIVKTVLGGTVGRAFLAIVVFAIFVCTLAVHTGTIRLVFAMARDGQLPFSRALSKVSGATHTPIVPAVVVGLAGSAILLLNVGYAQIVGLVASVAIVWANLAYLFVTIPLLRLRLAGWPGAGAGTEAFSLGRWGLLINVAAVLFGVFMVVNVAWPRPEVYGAAWHERHAAILFTLGLLALGAAYYAIARPGRAATAPTPAEAPAEAA